MFSLAAFAVCSTVAVPEATEQAMSYYRSSNMLWIFQHAFFLLIPLLFLFTGFSGKLAKFSEKLGKKWFFTIAAYLILYITINALIELPLDFYSGYIRQHSYGLSNQTVTRWFNNFGIETLVSTVSALLFIWIFYLLLRKSIKRWWIYSGFVTIGIIFISMIVQPIWIDPLFNKFGPMKDKELEKEILHLAARAGIEHGRVFEVDKSLDTKMINAYVTGVGTASRIVLWDTTINGLTKEQLLFVMAHEMGHYVLRHIWWSFLFSSFIAFVVIYLTYRSANFLLNRYANRFGFKNLFDIASLPLFIFLINLFMLLATPVINWNSRYYEREADRFGLEITKNNRAAGESFVVLQKENLANPRPGKIFKMWRSDHPSLGDRIDFFNRYCPWDEGKKLKYEKYFKG